MTTEQPQINVEMLDENSQDNHLKPEIPKLNIPDDPYAILEDESGNTPNVVLEDSSRNSLEDSDTNGQDVLCTNPNSMGSNGENFFVNT